MLKGTVTAAVLALSTIAAPAHANLGLVLAATQSPAGSTLRTAADGGYGQIALAPNDDESSGLYSMPFSVNFYGRAYDSLYVNNNGNVTFDTALGNFTPFSFGQLSTAMIAPYWADVDTRCAGCGNVYIGSFAPGQMSVTWNNVGYYSEHDDKLNNFQMTLFQSGSAGDFDIEFRYDRLEWTTGDASDGQNGLGGMPAAAGYTNGDGISYLQPGSFLSPGALNMATQSNTGTPGVWVYNIRNANTPPPDGTSSDNPILPTGDTPNDGYTFTFNEQAGTRYYVDPQVATGYDYSALGAMFTSVDFTSSLAFPGQYSLYDGQTLLGTIGANQVFTFGTALSSFQVRGIDPRNMLTPGDPTAFVTGFTFDRSGQVTVTQNPVAQDIPPALPEPATWAMMILGFSMAGGAVRYGRRTAKVAFVA